MAPKRLTRAEKRSETRSRLLESAAKVFVRRGFDGASVEEIAEDAGFSRGAFYSNFESKEEIFLTLIEGRTADNLLAIAEAFQRGDTAEERLVEGGRFIDSLVARDTEWCRLYMEFWANAVRNHKLQRRFAQQYRLWRGAIAQMIEAQSRDLGIPLDAPSEELASGLIALFEGFVLQKLIDPGLFRQDFFAGLLVRFFGRLAALDGGDGTVFPRVARQPLTRDGTEASPHG